MKKANLKIVGKLVDRQHEEDASCEEVEKSCKLTPAEIRAQAHEIRRYLEKFKDGLEGVPFDAVSEEPGSSIRDIGDVSISDLVESLNHS